jgi:hypothetical protein
MLYLNVLLQLLVEFIFSYLPSIMQQYQDLKLILLKSVTTLHVSAYSAIIRCVEMQGELLCLPLCCYRCFRIYSVLK